MIKKRRGKKENKRDEDEGNKIKEIKEGKKTKDWRDECGKIKRKEIKKKVVS